MKFWSTWQIAWIPSIFLSIEFSELWKNLQIMWKFEVHVEANFLFQLISNLFFLFRWLSWRDDFFASRLVSPGKSYFLFNILLVFFPNLFQWYFGYNLNSFHPLFAFSIRKFSFFPFILEKRHQKVAIPFAPFLFSTIPK